MRRSVVRGPGVRCVEAGDDAVHEGGEEEEGGGDPWQREVAGDDVVGAQRVGGVRNPTEVGRVDEQDRRFTSPAPVGKPVAACQDECRDGEREVEDAGGDVEPPEQAACCSSSPARGRASPAAWRRYSRLDGRFSRKQPAARGPLRGRGVAPVGCGHTPRLWIFCLRTRSRSPCARGSW